MPKRHFYALKNKDGWYWGEGSFLAEWEKNLACAMLKDSPNGWYPDYDKGEKVAVIEATLKEVNDDS